MADCAGQGHGGYGTSHPSSSGSATLLIVALAALGATSIATQIVLLREFLSVFYGNELIIGMVLANWMILTGLGSFLGEFPKRSARRRDIFVVFALIALALLPALTVALLRVLRNSVFLPGSMIGISQSFSSSLILLAPFCLVSGFSFALFATALSQQQGENLVSLSYSWESFGSAVGGAVFTLLLLPWLNTFQALALILTFDLALAIMIAHRNHHHLLSALGGALLIAAALGLGLGNPDTQTRRLLFPGQQLIAFKDTPYGNLTVTRQGDQLNFFENAVLMASTNDSAAAEEGVHYAMAQHPKPQQVLLIGGGISGTPQEILKYGVTAMDYAEVNPWIIGLAQGYTQTLTDPRIRTILDDARRHVRQTTERYDVVLINLPDPETAHLNRYFTVEFFTELKRVVSKGGVISLSLLPATEYQSAEARQLTSSLYATLKQIFANVLIVPGWRNYFLASDGPLDIHIGRLIQQRGVTTTYVNQYYLDDRMLAARSREITAALDPGAALNTDFTPVCYFQQLSYWLSSLGASTGPWIFLTLAAGLMMAWKFSAIGIGIFSAGLCASSLEITLLLAFQILYGSLYQMTGLVVTAFMAGLALGSWSIRRLVRQADIDLFITLQLMVALTGAILALVLPRLQGADLAPTAIPLIFTAMTFMVATLIGMEFAVASLIQTGTAAAIAGELYGLDLAGSAVGALLVTVYAIPLLGITKVSMAAGGVSAFSAALCVLYRKRYQTNVP